MRSYAMLSDHDFELLAADLLSAEDGVIYEVFARGADQGIDLRHAGSDGLAIVQCKHMLGSTYAQLKASVKKEAKKLVALDPQPSSYRLLTTQPLTPHRKSELATLLHPWVTKPSDVMGAGDLEGLLNRHEDVERVHVKLWLSSSAQLDERINGATWQRSRQLFEEIKEWLPRYVSSDAYIRARKRLREKRVIVISGPPGIGKTTLARMLLADAAVDGYEPVEISEDIDEAYALGKGRGPRAFYYDDFLGTTFLQDRLAKNEDKRLSSFMRQCVAGKTDLLVLTTREHILQQAVSWYDELERAGINLRKFLLELSSYKRFDRARIFYNHIWHSGQLGTEAKIALLSDRAYLRIVDHANYSPRLIEYLTGLSSRELGEMEQSDYIGFAVDILNDPKIIWKHAFDHQLDLPCRVLLLTIASLPGQVTVEDLEPAFLSSWEAASATPAVASFRDVLKVLDDSFSRSYEESAKVFIALANPSIGDYVTEWLNDNPVEALRLIDGSYYFEQVLWLMRKLHAPQSLQHQFGQAFFRAIQRCWSSVNPQWHEVLFMPDRELHTVRKSNSRSERLRLVRIQRWWALFDTVEASSWFDNQLREIADSWQSSAGNDSLSGVDLILALKRARIAFPLDVVEKLRDSLRQRNYSYAWSQLLSLRDAVPDAFPPDVVAVLKTECNAWVSSELDDLDNIDDVDALYEIQRVAGRMGVRIDQHPFEFAHEVIQSRQSEPDEDIDSSSPELENTSLAPADELKAMDALFSRLSEAAG